MVLGGTVNGYIDALRKYATFSGRARRSEFWLFMLINVAIVIALAHADSWLGTHKYLQHVFVLAMLLPSLAVTVRRLHDLDRSGHSIFLGMIPLVGGVILVVMLACDGRPYINEYGPDPKTGFPDYTNDDAQFARSHVRRYSDPRG